MSEMFKHLLACHRALFLVYQQIHWASKNTISFQDHLLAERLYTLVNENIDPIAEKAVGVTKSIDPIDLNENIKLIFEKIKKAPKKTKENGDLFSFALTLENEVIEYCTEYEKSDKITLGFKNLLADLSDQCEGRMYLLQQRLNK